MATVPIQPVYLPHGMDRFGVSHDLGIGTLEFKVTTAESQGALVIAELTHHTPGGPPLHMHPKQDEWFSVVEGRYRVVAGEQQFELGAGDSAFGPRGVPHTWAYLGGEPGRLLIVVSPAGKIEDFLLALSQANAVAPQDPAFWPPYELELKGPPLSLA